LNITRIDIVKRWCKVPAQDTEVQDGIKVVYHAVHTCRIVHIAVISMTPGERTLWRLIDPAAKKEFTDNLTLFDGAIHFTGTALQLIVPEGAFSNISPIENCRYYLKELEVMFAACQR
jgi:hypothetical protein